MDGAALEEHRPAQDRSCDACTLNTRGPEATLTLAMPRRRNQQRGNNPPRQIAEVDADAAPLFRETHRLHARLAHTRLAADLLRERMNQRAGMSFKLFHSLALALVFLRPTGPQRPRLDELASRDEIELDLHSPRWILIQTAMAEEREQTLLTIGKGLSALPLHQRKTSAPKLGKTQRP